MNGIRENLIVPPIHIITPVWGSSYTRCFLNVGITSLLAPGNLPALDRRRNHLLHVYAPESDREVIERSSIWQRIQENVRCRIDLIDGAAVARADAHKMMSMCHCDAITFANKQGAAMMFYNPDIVLADGGMQTLVRLLQEGKRAVQVVGLRLLKDDVLPQLMKQYVSADGTSLSISPRALMGVAMKHLHPISIMHLHDHEGEYLMPQELFWRIADEGIIARCFHIHPILVYPRNRDAKFTTTVDDDYLSSACPDESEVHIITD